MYISRRCYQGRDGRGYERFPTKQDQDLTVSTLTELENCVNQKKTDKSMNLSGDDLWVFHDHLTTLSLNTTIYSRRIQSYPACYLLIDSEEILLKFLQTVERSFYIGISKQNYDCSVLLGTGSQHRQEQKLFLWITMLELTLILIN